MKVTNFGPGGLPTALGGWSAGVMSIGSNATVQGGLTATNFVQRITSNSSNAMLNPIINFVGGSGVTLSAASNTITISSSLPPGGGYPEGSAMPAGPSVNQKFYRTDHNLLYQYNGTRWLCVCPHALDVSSQHALLTYSATNSLRSAAPEAITTTVWLATLDVGIFVVTTNDGTNYWTVAVNGFGSAVSTQSLAANTTFRLSTNLNAVFTISATKWLQVDYTKVATPGASYIVARIGYRHIGT